MKIADMPAVKSAHIKCVGHDGTCLYVGWNDGRVSRYSGVPADVHQRVVEAESVGGAVHRLVKGKFPHEYLPPEDGA